MQTEVNETTQNILKAQEGLENGSITTPTEYFDTVNGNKKQTPPSPEEQKVAARKLTEQQMKVLSELTRIHLASYLQDLAFKPGLSGNKKQAMIIDLLDGMQGILDLGVEITNVQVPEKGSNGRKVASLAGIMAQAMDTRMILLAQNLETAEKNNVIEETTNNEVNNG